MLSDSDEESEDIAVSPYKEPEKHEASGEDVGVKGSETDSNVKPTESLVPETSPKKFLASPAEKVVSRIARLWRQHMEETERSGAQRDHADRLAMSKEYREWVTTVDLDLKCGEGLPSFTDLWVELNKPAEPSKRESAQTGEEEWQQSRQWNDWSGHHRKSWHPRWQNKRQAESWNDDEHKEARIVLAPASRESRPVLKEVPRGSGLALKPAPTVDPELADFAAEGSRTYLRERDAALRDGRYRGQDRPVSPDRPPRHKAHLSPANNSRYDWWESLRLFDDYLQDLCNRGLKTDLPIRASVFWDEMQQRDPDFRIHDTPFRDFSDLLKAAAGSGLIKAQWRGQVEYITYIKYDFRLLTRRDEYRPERERRRRRVPSHRSRSRSRSRDAPRHVEIREVSRRRHGGDRRATKRASSRQNRSHRRGDDGARDERKSVPKRSAREKRREAALKTAKAKARPKALTKEGVEERGIRDQMDPVPDRRIPAKSMEGGSQPLAKQQASAVAMQAKIQARTQKLAKETQVQGLQAPQAKAKTGKGGNMEEGKSSSSASYYSDEDSNESSSSSDESDESESEAKENM